MARYGMVIDLERCTGCRACMVGCKVENNTPQGAFWMHVARYEKGDYPNTRVSFLPRPCMHCDNAPCVKVCPVGARYKRADGIVATDWERCIGCRYCEVACPYGVNFFNWQDPNKNYYLAEDADVAAVTEGATPPYSNPDLEQPAADGRFTAGGGHTKGVMDKCTFCVQRVEKDLQPACANTCPTFAIAFGDLDDPQSKVSTLLRQRSHWRLLEETGTEPRVYYTGGEPPTGAVREIEQVQRKA